MKFSTTGKPPLTAMTTRVALAALALALLALSAVDADARSAKKTQLRRAPDCAPLVVHAKRAATTRIFAIPRAQGLSCRKARKVVKKCVRGKLHRSWKASETPTHVLLRRGKARVRLKAIAGAEPRCVTRRLERKRTRGLLTSRGDLRPQGEFGPWQYPLMHPANPDRPSTMTYDWSSPVTTYRASIGSDAVSTVYIEGFVRNVRGEVLSAWFEYGPTRDFSDPSTQRTPSQAVGIIPSGSPINISARLTHLRARTRYFWRAAAKLDSGEVKYGTIGAFVTNSYPNLVNASRPCQNIGGYGQLELTESLLIVCDKETFSRGACFPACADFYSGKLQCTRDFPRNLNAGSWQFTLPKVGLPVSVNKLVSYWRSNDSNRFLELPGKNTNSEGSDVGPTPGWHNWDVAQWAYPATSTSTTVEFWIHCTEQWGRVIDGSSLAKGEGSDLPSVVPPSVPRNLKAQAASDGGITLTWDAPESVSPTGLAGYAYALLAWSSTSERAFASYKQPLTATGTSGKIPAGYVKAIKALSPAGTKPYVVVAAVSQEGSIGPLAWVEWKGN